MYQPLIRRSLLLLSPFWFHSFIHQIVCLLLLVVCVCMKNIPPLKNYQPLIRRTILLFLSPFWLHSFIKVSMIVNDTPPLLHHLPTSSHTDTKILQIYMMVMMKQPLLLLHTTYTIHTDITHTHTQYVCPPSVNSQPMMMTLITYVLRHTTTHTQQQQQHTHIIPHTFSRVPPLRRIAVEQGTKNTNVEAFQSLKIHNFKSSKSPHSHAYNSSDIIILYAKKN
jgi:hypothetical protein